MRKLIMVTVALLIVVMLFAFAMPLMSSDVGVAGESTSAGVASLAVMDSEAALVIESNTVSASASIAEISIWLALGAILVTFAVVCSRRLHNFFDVKNVSLRLSNGSTDEGAKTGRGPRDCIMPTAA